MKLLAIDQGSNACGFAYFDGDDVKPRSTDWVRAPAGAWIERMRYIDTQLRAAARARSWQPDVVAIEDVVLYVHHAKGLGVSANVQTVLTMGETRGWIKNTVWQLFPRARSIDINPASVKAVAGARGRRDLAKLDIARAVATMTGLTGLGEDEADAIAVGWAAFGKVNETKWRQLADQQIVPRAAES